MNKFLSKINKFFSVSKKFVRNNQIKVYIILFAVLLVNMLFFPTPSSAKIFEENIDFTESKLVWSIKNTFNINSIIEKSMVLAKNKENNHLPDNKTITEVSYTLNVVLTAYNSEVGQCDDTPCITANGFNLCKNGKEDSIAMNGIKMGTRVRIPSLFGEKVFIVRDRMNSRYNITRADIWMLERSDAIKFGARRAQIEVLES